MKELKRSIGEVLRRVLGYFGKDKNAEEGPTLLGMETPEHRKVTSAQKIKKAVYEVKELYKNAKIK